jgi:hypothetical protein
VISSRSAGAQRVSFALFSAIKARKFEKPSLAMLLDAAAGPAQVGGDPGGPAQILCVCLQAYASRRSLCVYLQAYALRAY